MARWAPHIEKFMPQGAMSSEFMWIHLFVDGDVIEVGY
jgi:hypothetical protein